MQQPLSLKARALRWLAQREHSRAELERKLLRSLQAQARKQEQADASAAAAGQGARTSPPPQGPLPGPEEIAAVLDRLAAAGLLSDERAAASVLNSQAARSGQRRLQQLLQAKGLPDDIVRQSLAEVHSSEFDRAWALWQRRYGQPPRDAAQRARQQRFLAARGFSFDIVARVLRQAGAPLYEHEPPPDS